MPPRQIRPDQLVEVLPPGGLTWLQACSAESLSIRDGILAAEGRLGPMTFTGIFVPRLNRLDYLVQDGRRVKTFFLTPELTKTPAAVEFLPLCYRDIIAYLSSIRIDAALFMISPPDAQGLCSFGPVADFLPELWHRIPVRIGHINPRLPRTRGYAAIPWAELTAVIETEADILVSKPAPPDNVAGAISRYVAELVPEGATIQAGLGRVPEAALAGLRSHRNLRFHSGLIGDAVLDLLEAGALAPGTSVTAGVAIGTRRLYDALEDEAFTFKPATFTHSQQVMAGLQRFVTINSVAEVDLLGSGLAEHAPDGLISGPGGASDFAAGAAANNGLRIIALPSTANDGETSRIVAAAQSPAPVSLNRFHIDCVVTEFGIADLRFKTHRGRAEALIGIASPQHRPALEEQWRAWCERFHAY